MPARAKSAPVYFVPHDRALQVEHDLLGTILDTTGTLVVVLDRQGRIVRFNRSCEQATGYDVTEVRGRPFWELSPPEEVGAAHEALEALRAGKPTARHESCWVTRDGQRRWIAWSSTAVRGTNGSVDFVIETGVDMTEREQARAALAWEAGVNGAVAELSRALISLASVDEISALVLEQAQRLTGSPYGFVGYIDPQSGSFVSPTMTRDIWDVCQVPGKGAVFHEFSGLWGWVLSHRRPLLSNSPAADPRSSGVPAGHIPIQRFLAAPAMLGESLVGMVALANAPRDYAAQDLQLVERMAQLYALAVQRQRAEEALQQHALKLQAQNAELDSFAHTVAHELKSPLAVILGYAQILEAPGGSFGQAERQEATRAILNTGRRMNSIIQEILLLASMRQEAVSTGPLDMQRIVSSALERMGAQIQEARPEIVVPAEWPVALGYAPWVEEAWTNYLSNGLKYGGTPPRLELGADGPESGMVRFWVRDNGPGLTQDQRSNLFAPFSQLQPVRAQGHGLGLSIVRHIVQRLGGQVGVESEPGRGSTFFLTLPAAMHT